MEARRNAIHVDFLKSDAGIKRHLALKKRGMTPSELPRQGSGSNHGAGWAQYCPGPNRPLFTGTASGTVTFEQRPLPRLLRPSEVKVGEAPEWALGLRQRGAQLGVRVSMQGIMLGLSGTLVNVSSTLSGA